MSKKTIHKVKIILGAYITFIGSMLFIDVYDQKPSDMPAKIIIAVSLVGIGIYYVVKNVQNMLEKVKIAKAEQISREQAEEEERRHNELHNKNKFRTAPMRVVRPVSLEKSEEELEDFEEEKIIVTNYEEETIIENRKEFRREAESDRKAESEKREPEKESVQQPSINIVEERPEAEENKKSEELAINIEESEEKEEN